MMNIELPISIKEIMKKLEESGYEAYLVGGAVRDYLLGLTPLDYDLATNASVTELKDVFKDYKIIDTGLKHGTISLLLSDMIIEITTYRDPSRTLEGDLALRDFTINSIAYSLNKGIVDYQNGFKDINDRIIRLNGSDDSRFKEDPLRLLRAIRLAATFNFNIDDNTKKYIFEDASLLRDISVERINNEFSRILTSEKPSFYMREYFDVITVFIPELRPLKGFSQNNPHHSYDCLEHTLIVLDNVIPSLIMRLAALFHDSGKPSTYTEDNRGVGHFYGHSKVSVAIVKQVLKRLKYDNDTIDRVINIVNFHDYPLTLTKKSLRKLLSRFGLKDIYLLLDMKKADSTGKNINIHNHFKEIEEARIIIDEIIKNDCFSLNDLAIKGSDLIAIGIEEGKEIGNILNMLLDLVMNEQILNDYDLLLEQAKKIKNNTI